MKITWKRALSSSLLIVYVLSQLFLFTSCTYPSKHHFDQDNNQIVRIEIVEADYNTFNKESQRVLFSITDFGDFLDELGSINYKSHFYNGAVMGLNNRSLAIKITYSNEEYEVFNDSLKSSYTNNQGYKLRVTGFYDDEEFYGLR